MRILFSNIIVKVLTEPKLSSSGKCWMFSMPVEGLNVPDSSTQDKSSGRPVSWVKVFVPTDQFKTLAKGDKIRIIKAKIEAGVSLGRNGLHYVNFSMFLTKDYEGCKTCESVQKTENYQKLSVDMGYLSQADSVTVPYTTTEDDEFIRGKMPCDPIPEERTGWHEIELTVKEEKKGRKTQMKLDITFYTEEESHGLPAKLEENYQTVSEGDDLPF